MTKKQLECRIRTTTEALRKEHIRNVEKQGRVGWGSGFRKQYVGPCCRRENELESRLQGFQDELKKLQTTE